jgi:phosphate starvation-inducible protein PhoH
MAKQKDITYNQLSSIKPVTDSQKKVFETWKQGLNQFLFGCAGPGKTCVTLSLA